MSFWLMKSEPSVFSIDHLRRAPKQTSGWDGVRNYQARNYLKSMKKGDRALFYYSSVVPAGVAGVMEIVLESYPDPTQFEREHAHYDDRSSREKPLWFQVDVRLVSAFRRVLSLEELRADKELAGMVLFKNSRLSVQPVTGPQWTAILKMAETL